MSNIVLKTSDELCDADDLEISNLHKSSDVFIVLPFSDNEDKEILNIVKDLGTALNFEGKIFAYQEPGGKGGGAGDILPSLSDVIFYSLAFVITTSAHIFITELTKDIYKSYLKKLFDKRKKYSYDDGKIVMKLNTSKEVTISYYFQKYLTDDEFFDALKSVKNHFLQIENSKEEIENYDYIYDRKDNTWLAF